MKSKSAKIDTHYKKLMEDIMKERYKKGLATFRPMELSIREATSLITKCPSWARVEREMRNLPKKNGK